MKTELLLRRMGRIKGEGPELEGACPEDEVLLALREDRVTLEEREQLEGHLAECARCLDHLLCLRWEQPTMESGTLRRVLAATEPEHLEQRRLARMPQWALGAVAAAALVLVFIIPRTPTDQMPPYDLTVAGGVAAYRGGDGAEKVERGEPGVEKPGEAATPISWFTPDSNLSLWLTPSTGARAANPAVAAYLRQPDGSWRRFEPAPQVAVDGKSGQIEVTIRAGELLGERFGKHEILVAVLPSDHKAPERLQAGESDLPGAEVVRTEIDYRSL